MIFYNEQDELNKKEYEKFLTLVGSLSNLFSDSKNPYLYYRIAERIFCHSFDASDLSRSDVSIDAKKGDIGIGLKTFLLGNNKTFQKVAEFNKDSSLFLEKKIREKIETVALLRNERIEFSENLYDINKLIYHCVLRDKNNFKIYEESMDKIDLNNISNIKKGKNSILFDDGNHEYSFLLSKNTLTKRFNTENILHSFKVDIIKDPLFELNKCFEKREFLFEKNKKIKETIYLPLYGNNFKVFDKSGLNQWNAAGRKRDKDEAYIPIPIIIHKKFPSFFPSRDTSFDLILPNGKSMKSKLCQDNSKALMSYSNKELGKWILRDILKLKEGELLTYSKLIRIGIDSVRIDKISDNCFEINFSKIGSFENFKANFLV